jgi:Ca-activated chloride channel homolog
MITWGITWASPLMFWFLLALPLFIALYIRGLKRRKLTIRFTNLALVRKADKGRKHWIRHTPFILRMMAFGLLVAALARPQKGDEQITHHTEGVDIMLLLDVSGSMMVTDMITPSEMSAVRRMNAEEMLRTGKIHEFSRFGYAKQTMLDFIERRRFDRIGLVVFSLTGYLQCPLTSDHGVLRSLVRGLDMENFPGNATAIGDGLMTALKRLEQSPAKSKVIVLLTDGANNAGTHQPLMAANVAQAMGVRVYTVGVGKLAGTVLTLQQNPFTGAITWGERPVDQSDRVDEPLMREISKRTGGQFFHAQNKTELEDVYKLIDELETTEVKSNVFTRYHEHFYLLLLAGAILFLLELLLASTRFVKIP